MFFLNLFKSLDHKWQELSSECKQKHLLLVEKENIAMGKDKTTRCGCSLFDNFDAKNDRFWEKHIACFKERNLLKSLKE